MEQEKQARRTVNRVMLAFSLHLVLLLGTALSGVPAYSVPGICLVLVRFLLPILLLLAPPLRCERPQLCPDRRSGWLDLIPAWALLLLFGLLIPGSDQLPQGPFPLLAIQLVVLTPILEELLFRGLPLAHCKHFDKRVILLLLSLLFALLHSGYTKGYAFLAGLVLGIGLLLGRGLLFSVTLHACNNLTTLLFLYWKQSAPDAYLSYGVPIYRGFVCFLVIVGAVIAFLRAKRGCYHLPKQICETEDGAPLPPARLATPLSAVLLICFVLVTLLL